VAKCCCAPSTVRTGKEMTAEMTNVLRSKQLRASPPSEVIDYFYGVGSFCRYENDSDHLTSAIMSASPLSELTSLSTLSTLAHLNDPTPAVAPPPIPSLSDHTTAQAEKIDKLLGCPNSPLHTLNSDASYWEGFRNTFWRKNSVPVQVEAVNRGNDPVPSDLPTTCSTLKIPQPVLKAWSLKCQRILVWSEYKEAEDAVRSAHNQDRDVFMVDGHPGIGVLPSHSIICRI